MRAAIRVWRRTYDNTSRFERRKGVHEMKTRLFATFVVAGLMLVSGLTARAESIDVRIPFAFTVGGKMLSPGVYNLDAVSPGILLVRGDTPGASAFVMVVPEESGIPSGKAGISFSKSSGLASASRVTLPSGITYGVVPAKYSTSSTGPVLASK
jgi:hypothetical protein